MSIKQRPNQALVSTVQTSAKVRLNPKKGTSDVDEAAVVGVFTVGVAATFTLGYKKNETNYRQYAVNAHEFNHSVFSHSSRELRGFNLFFVTLYLLKCIDPDVPVYLLFLYTVVLVL